MHILKEKQLPYVKYSKTNASKDAHLQVLTPSKLMSLTSVSSLLKLSGSVLVTGRRRTGWPDTAEVQARIELGSEKSQMCFQER